MLYLCLYLTIIRVGHVFVFFSALKTIYVLEPLLFIGLITLTVQICFSLFFDCLCNLFIIYPFHPFITRFIRGWKMDWIRVDG